MDNLFLGAVLLIAVVFALLWLRGSNTSNRRLDHDVSADAHRLRNDDARLEMERAQENRAASEREVSAKITRAKIQAIIEREESKHCWGDKQAIAVGRAAIAAIDASGAIPPAPEPESSGPHWSEFC